MKNNDLKPYGTYLNMLAHKYDKGQVFEDFLQIIVCCLQMGRAEELYFKTIKKYSRDELQYFSLAFASLVDEMTRKELQDPFYGWFEQNLLNAGSGQFFTPRPVANLLAQLVYIPTVDKVVQAITVRDNAEVLPSGMTALNALGLSTQVPMNYTFLTTGSERTINLSNRKVVLKRGVPKNFCYGTLLISLLVQALKALKKENIGESELNIIRQLVSKETDKEALSKDVDMMPAWMKRIIKPMLTA